MANNHFIVSKITDLSQASLGDEIPCSDFTCVSGDKLVQLEYIEEDARDYEIVQPGLFAINEKNHRLYLEKTSFTQERLLESFTQTQKLTNAIGRFFNKLHVYKKRGKSVPTRNILVWGPPGGGKSSSITHATGSFLADGKSAVLLWYTDKHDADEVKNLVKSFRYEGVERLIIVAEDIGGVEAEQAKLNSLPSLLSLLDNKEMVFTLPTMIIGTTNFPESLLGNISNRRGRFSDRIHIDYPDSENRKELLAFFLQDKATPEVLEKIGHKKYKEFAASDLEEISLRAELDDISFDEAIDSIHSEIQQYKQMFQTKQQSLGIEA